MDSWGQGKLFKVTLFRLFVSLMNYSVGSSLHRVCGNSYIKEASCLPEAAGLEVCGNPELCEIDFKTL